MIGRIKSAHKSASRWAGQFGSESKLAGHRLSTGSGKGAPNAARQEALNKRGSRRMMGAYAVGGVAGVRTVRGSSSGSEGLQAHSMGGTTMY